jgi:hypothetical protein
VAYLRDMARRARPQVYVTDMTHLVGLENIKAPFPAPAKRLAAYLGSIVRAASIAPADVPNISGVACRRRPGRKPCPGTIVVVRALLPSKIEWCCPSCGEGGVISNWKGTPWDASEHRSEDELPIAPDGGLYH